MKLTSLEGIMTFGRVPTVVGLAVLGLVMAAPSHGDDDDDDGDSRCLEFSELSIILEQNATDMDSEVVIFAKGGDEGLGRFSVTAPNGRKVARFDARGRGVIGIREFNLESPEPPDLQEVLGAFPEGTYRFRGRTMSGDCLRGEASLSHAIAMASELIAPGEGEILRRDEVVVTWAAVPEAEVYIIELQNEETEEELVADVPRSDLSFVPPEGWLVPDTEYQVSVAVKIESGNITVVESFFFTAFE